MGHNSRPGAFHERLYAEEAKQVAEDDALRVVLAWNERLSTKRLVLFSPTIRCALMARHHWLSVLCPSCETVKAIDLTVVRRPPDMTIHEILPALKCTFCRRGRGAIPLGLTGLQGARHTMAEPEPRDIANARLMAEALTEIAQHGVGDNAIRSVHEMTELAERALNYVGIEWLKSIKPR